jgi:2-polyprenyl-3-methyl-5-hydroxy-6-metoxy-1,4-benzoquinol methylase
MGFPETPDIVTSSADYATRFSGPIGHWLLAVQERATLHLIRDVPGARVLDVGGGHGQLTAPLIRAGYQVTVVGSAPVCAERIASFVETRQCQFEVGDILSLPFEDQSFDVVLSYRLVSHVNQWQLLLRELARVAKQMVMIDYPAWCSLNALTPVLFSFKRLVEKNTRQYLSFRERDLLRVFAASGFTRAQRYPEFFLPMVLHRALKAPALSATLEGMCRSVGFTHQFGSPVILKVVRRQG